MWACQKDNVVQSPFISICQRVEARLRATFWPQLMGHWWTRTGRCCFWSLKNRPQFICLSHSLWSTSHIPPALLKCQLAAMTFAFVSCFFGSDCFLALMHLPAVFHSPAEVLLDRYGLIWPGWLGSYPDISISLNKSGIISAAFDHRSMRWWTDGRMDERCIIYMSADRLLKQCNIPSRCNKFITHSRAAAALSSHSQGDNDQNQQPQITFGPNNCQLG